MNYSPLTDIELFDLIVAAYPEKFGEREETDDLWDEVMGFVEEGLDGDLEDEFGLRRFLGRIVMLTMPMTSTLRGTERHVLGKVEKVDSEYRMTAAVNRPVIDSGEP